MTVRSWASCQYHNFSRIPELGPIAKQSNLSIEIVPGRGIQVRILAWVEIFIYHPASEANREVANLTERKNQLTPVYRVKEFVSLSVRL